MMIQPEGQRKAREGMCAGRGDPSRLDNGTGYGRTGSGWGVGAGVA